MTPGQAPAALGVCSDATHVPSAVTTARSVLVMPPFYPMLRTVNGLYETDLVYGPGACGWDGVDELELATLGLGALVQPRTPRRAVSSLTRARAAS